MKHSKRRRWSCVFGDRGKTVAFIEEEEGGTWCAYVGGLHVGNIANEETARAFVEKTMTMADD